MATFVEGYVNREAPNVKVDPKWKELAAEGRLLDAIGDWMAFKRDMNMDKAQRAVFNYIRRMPKKR